MRKKIYEANPPFFIPACSYETAPLVAKDMQNYQPLVCLSDGTVNWYMKHA
jgi:hypothetical protein